VIDTLWWGEELDKALSGGFAENTFSSEVADCASVTYVIPVEPHPLTGLPETEKVWFTFELDLRSGQFTQLPRRQYGQNPL
jgi:hypothetical protein